MGDLVRNVSRVVGQRADKSSETHSGIHPGRVCHGEKSKNKQILQKETETFSPYNI